MKAVLEGLLFVVGDDGLDINQMKELLNLSLEEIKPLLKELKTDYCSNERGIDLELLGNKFKLTTKKEHKQFYEKLTIEENNKELSQAALETLAIIAYNEPITRIEIDEIRGVSSSHIVRKLILRDLVKSLGRADIPGKPNLYGTTDKFLDYFGLKNKEELPIIATIKEEKEEIDLFSSKYKEEI